MQEADLEQFKKKVLDAFKPDGPLARATGGYVVRPSQIEMAMKIVDSLATGKSFIAEAGTGTGKTFAYMVPALLYGGKVLISTAGKTLQDQLYFKDLPALSNVLGIPFKKYVLKGRQNYVCLKKLEESYASLSSEESVAKSKDDVRYIQFVHNHIGKVRTGERSEFKSVPERAPVWQNMTCQSFQCDPVHCEFKDDCYVQIAKRKAREADVLVVNHHLFLADMSIKMNEIGEVLPDFDLYILDEAHKIPKDAESFFTDTLSLAEVKKFTTDFAAYLMVNGGKDSGIWGEEAKKVSNACEDLRNQFAVLGVREDFKISLSDLRDSHLLAEPMEYLAKQLDSFLEEAQKVESEDAESLPHYLTRLAEFSLAAKYWAKELHASATNKEVLSEESIESEALPSVKWVTVQRRNVNFNVTPLTFRKIFQKYREEKQKPWVTTSATLSINKDFSHFAEQLGLEDAEVGSWPSPFDFWEQGLLYVPSDAPDPNSPDFSEFVADHSWPLVKRIGGKTLYLCTSLRAVKAISERLTEKIVREHLDLELFVQDEAPRNELINKFRNSDKGILIGSMSFWEGIDIKGQALSMVIVDKVPFTPPDEPILRGKKKLYETEKRNYFYESALPEAIKLLQQGTGRLIRDAKDWGVVGIFDRRIITTKTWGPKVWQALPEYRRTDKFERVMEFLDEKGVPRLKEDKKRSKA